MSVSPKRKKQRIQGVIDYRKRTKLRMVEAMGGKCVCCGYNKFPDVLEFHHLDPKTKSFSIGGARANPKAWPTIVAELRKCVMMCSNCHKEVEYCGRQIPDDAARFNEFYATYDNLKALTSEYGTFEVVGESGPFRILVQTPQQLLRH